MSDWTRPPVAVRAGADARTRSRALALARRLGLPLVDSAAAGAPRVPGPTAEATWWLDYDASGSGLALVRPDGARVAPEFAVGRARAHASERDLAGQPLARATGLGRRPARIGNRATADGAAALGPWLVDATAGFGIDAWLAATLGARVTLLEREPIAHALLEDALARARAATDERTRMTAARVGLELADAARWLESFASLAGDGDGNCGNADADGGESLRPDIVYLDPMYPPARRRGRSKKGIDALHALVGPDHDNAGLLAAALFAARSRVVVKRPAGAPRLEAGAAEAATRCRRDAIEAPNTRYDRYLLD